MHIRENERLEIWSGFFFGVNLASVCATVSREKSFNGEQTPPALTI